MFARLALLAEWLALYCVSGVSVVHKTHIDDTRPQSGGPIAKHGVLFHLPESESPHSRSAFDWLTRFEIH